MNQKQLGLILVLLVVLGGAGYLFWKKQNASWGENAPSLGQKLLGDFPLNDVARITITDGSNALNLVKRDDLWRVAERGDYPANYPDISSFLLKARDLKIVQSLQVGPSQLPRLQLAPAGRGSNSAVVVEFKDAGGKTIKTLLLGKKHLRKSSGPSQFGEGDEGWPDGRYVKTGDAADVAVVSDPLDNIEAKPAEWLNKDLIHVEKAKFVQVDFPAATNSWKLARETETAEWKLVDARPGEELDPSKAGGVSSPLSSASLVDVLVAPKAPALGLDKPTTVTIGTFEGFNYVLEVGQKTNDDFPVTISVSAQIAKERTPGKDEKPEEKTKLDKSFADQRQKLEDKLKQEQACANWTYLLASWTLEPLLKERSQLLMEKKEEPAKGAAAATNSVEATVAPK